ncbi:sensor histidine kinase [Pigmentibacter ruber]|uniref:sensor histidine kinase n=1 Tax=Pigmentibacter ruber TaxID=2683196 RepID=UPI00131AC73B|nr:HAMP domain-containing sensor histidine kinase [Pigmentibacter ruber]
MKIKSLVTIVLIISLIIFINSLIIVVSHLIQIEKEKIEAISPRIIRVLSNEILLGNKKSLDFTIKKIIKLYNLENIIVSKEFIKCKFYEISCINTNTEMISPASNIYIKGNNVLSKKILLTIALSSFIIIILFLVIIIIITKNIKKPLEDIVTQIKIDKNNNIVFHNFLNKKSYKIYEINIIYDYLFKTTKEITKIIEKNNNYANELKISKYLSNTSKIFAHDVRKPFSLLKNLNQILTSEIDNNTKQKIFLETMPIIKEAIISVESLINDTLDLGKKITLELTKEDPIEIMNIVVEEIKCTLNHKNINFIPICNFSEKINIDKYRIIRVIRNIIHNAIEAMKGSGTINILIDKIFINNKNFIEFRIKNENSYIKEDIISKIFDLYYTSNKREGNGLGLYISKNIIELHNGKIWCESKKISNENQYVEFIFIIPLDLEISSNPT